MSVFIPPLTQRPDLIEAVPGPSGKQKRKNSNRVLYDASSIDKLLDQIRSGNLTAYQAAKKSGVPRTTLQYRLSSKWKNKGSRGPNTIFTEEEEREIVQQLLNLEQRGIPLTQRAVVFKVTKYLKAKPRTTPFKEGQPGKIFFIYSFVFQAQACLLSEFCIEKWLATFRKLVLQA